jgi:predicted protein tyrosine phosphatase
MGNLHGLVGSARWGLMVRAAVTSVLLSVLFVVVYGSTNWFTAQRPSAHIGSWLFDGELTAIPYVPWLIIPYMSQDLFFFFATFLCGSHREIRTFARRVVFSILIGAAFFLLMPLKLEWPSRPAVGGWFGDFVEQSCTAPFLMEYPHNLFPSLHIVLCMIVADVYLRHTRGILRGLLFGWFTLIGVSTVLTWQHHVPDVLGGAMLAGFAFYSIRDRSPRLAGRPNPRIGGYYAVGAVALLALSPIFGIWGVFMLWPATALGVMAAAYCRIGPGVFRKTGGRLPLSTRFVMLPVLIGHYLSLIYYRRQCRAYDEVTPSLLIGRVLDAAEADHAVEKDVTAVLDLTAEFSEATPFPRTQYKNLPILDLTAPTQEQLHDAAAFIATHLDRGIVYVHCKIGYSRSAAVVAAYLLESETAVTVNDAIAILRQARPAIKIRPEVIDALHSFAASLKMSRPRRHHFSASRNGEPQPTRIVA